MIKHNQDGAVSGVVISLVMTVVLLLGAIGFGAWAFTGREDYKNNSDQKVAAAVEVAKKQESAAKDKQFNEQYKNPLNTYLGPDGSGSLQLSFPKTWSGYMLDGSPTTLEAYFAPKLVPNISSANSVYALRVRVLAQDYSQTVRGYTGLAAAGSVKISAYSLPKLPKVVGVQIVGKVSASRYITMVIMPIRSQTLQVWTEGDQYVSDFNNYILPNLSFAP